MVELVRRAGAVAMRYFRNDVRAWEKTPGAVVTEADLAIDSLLARELPLAGDAWLSEESADDPGRLAADRLWIVDPIDGTRSYVAGKAEFAISVALWTRASGVVLGVVLNPATDELFLAARGRGAWRNGVPSTLRPWSETSETKLLVSGREARKVGFDRRFPGCDVRGLGSLAYRLALIAAGEADGLVSLRQVADWDLAAAALMIEEAGGRITDRHGRALVLNAPSPKHAGLVVAAPRLHRALGATLATLAA